MAAPIAEILGSLDLENPAEYDHFGSDEDAFFGSPSSSREDNEHPLTQDLNKVEIESIQEREGKVISGALSTVETPIHTQSSSGGASLCRFGVACRRIDCMFAHPKGRAMEKAQHMGMVMPAIFWNRDFVQTVAAAGLIAYAEGPSAGQTTQSQKGNTIYACLVVERRFEKSKSRTVVSLPGGMWDRKYDADPHGCAVREFHEETRGIFFPQKALIRKSLVEGFPMNTIYSSDGKYLVAAARVNFIDEIAEHFKEGKRIDDSSISLVWVPIVDMIQKRIQVFMSKTSGGSSKKVLIPVSEFLSKLLHSSDISLSRVRSGCAAVAPMQELLAWIVDSFEQKK